MLLPVLTVTVRPYAETGTSPVSPAVHLGAGRRFRAGLITNLLPQPPAAVPAHRRGGITGLDVAMVADTPVTAQPLCGPHQHPDAGAGHTVAVPSLWNAAGAMSASYGVPVKAEDHLG